MSEPIFKTKFKKNKKKKTDTVILFNPHICHTRQVLLLSFLQMNKLRHSKMKLVVREW